MTPPAPIAPRRHGLALVAEGPSGDRVLGHVAAPGMSGECSALDVVRAGEWPTAGELADWLGRAEGLPCRIEPVGLVSPRGGGGPP